MKRSLGCLSTGAIGATLLTLLILVAVLALGGGKMFSPGALNAQAGDKVLGQVRSHAETAGHCAACHPAPWSPDTMSDRCLACHDDVRQQISDRTGLHSTLVAGDPSARCAACHPDHRGLAAELTVLDEATFPHRATGYSLDAHKKTAAGQPFTCSDCHGQNLARFDVAVCADCHRQIDAAFMQAHIAAFGTECLPCHDGRDSYGKQFDHNKVVFALSGKHAGVDCARCHPGARTIADLKAAPRNCDSCHAKDDAHNGQFGKDCGSCHTTGGWQPASFDHSKSAFPLTGQHANVACQDCHKNNVFKGTPTDCYSCHAKDDAHGGQFGQDCAACHNPNDWGDVTFDHSKTAFPLTGQHAQLDCGQCHVNNVFKGTSTACSACHEDPAFHRGLFGTSCQDCHTTDGWSPATFNQAHDAFPINHGAEGGTSACSTCHPDNLMTYTCYGCHEHQQAEIAAKHQEERITDFTDCIRCHRGGGREGGGGGDD